MSKATSFCVAMGVLTCMVSSTLVPTPAQAGDCGRLCNKAFWQSAAPEDVQAELAKDSDLEARDQAGLTPLHRAAANNANPAMMTTLVKAGANIEARTKDGETPLHKAAAFNGNPAVVKFLLGAGADPKAKTADGRTAFDLIQNNKKLKDTDAYRRLNDLQYK